jgi:hypothetical protein
MKSVTVVLLVLASFVVPAGAAAHPQRSGPKPIVVTFHKHVVDPANLIFQGTTGGRVKGSLESRMVPGSLRVEGAIWHFAFDWIVHAKARNKSFIARTAGTFDTTTGRVVMDGTVTQGWHEGAPVHEEGRLLDPATYTFAGELQIARHCDDR